MDKKDLNRLSHMLDAAKTVSKHIVSKTAADLEQDRLLLGGVIRELLLIGEAANSISLPAQKTYPEIPWRMIVGMRNQLIHGYFEISHKIIWSTVTEDIPKLITVLEKIMARHI